MCTLKVKNRRPLHLTNQVSTRKWLLITIIKNPLWRTDYKSDVMKNRLQNWRYQKAITKEWLPKTIRKWPLPKIKCPIIVTIETTEIIIIIFNSYQKMVKIVSNNHKQLTVLTVTKSRYGLWTFFYLNIIIVLVALTRFLFHYVVNIVRSSLPP
jgi:hypothetical protein